MMATHWLLAAILGLMLTGGAGMHTGAGSESRAELAPTGKLRVAFLSSAAIYSTKDPATETGVDTIKWDNQGKIVEFKVMLHPLKAINLIHEKMAAMLRANQQFMQTPGLSIGRQPPASR